MLQLPMTEVTKRDCPNCGKGQKLILNSCFGVHRQWDYNWAYLYCTREQCKFHSTPV
jgi:hypothetical protein